MPYPFVAFEGGEGSGKSTQARLLYRRLISKNLPALLVHEPGGTPLGDAIRRYLKKGGVEPLAELMLFAASRAQLVARVIRPGLGKGMVITDRYVASSIAYQGEGRGLGREVVEQVNALATQNLKPDITFLLDISPELGLARKDRSKRDAFEEEDIAFHRHVREGYLKLASAEPERWLVVDATLPRVEVREVIWRRMWQELTRRRLV